MQVATAARKAAQKRVARRTAQRCYGEPSILQVVMATVVVRA